MALSAYKNKTATGRAVNLSAILPGGQLRLKVLEDAPGSTWALFEYNWDGATYTASSHPCSTYFEASTGTMLKCTNAATTLFLTPTGITYTYSYNASAVVSDFFLWD